MIKSDTTATQGRQNHKHSGSQEKHNVVEPKSRLNLQAADRETSLVRKAISILLLEELLLKLLFRVWPMK